MESLFRCMLCNRRFLYCEQKKQFTYLKTSSFNPEPCRACALLCRKSQEEQDNTVEVKCSRCDMSTRVPYTVIQANTVYCSNCIQTLVGTNQIYTYTS